MKSAPIKLTPTIGLVDDDPSILRALSRLMRAKGFAVTTFSSGTEFLSSLAQSQPDCLVLDAQMPAMNGLDLQLRLSSADPTLPLIFITAHEDPQAEQLALSRGAVAFLYKPVRCETLCAAIRAALGQGAAAS